MCSDRGRKVKLSDLFDAINDEMIQSWMGERKEENLTLEFKTVNSPTMDNRDDRKNFAKALSGFANSSGGLLVWGVQATRNQDGIDCATGSSIIQPCASFLAKLNQREGECVFPVVDGVQHKAISIGGDSGYAATLIPESDSGPHMAKAGEDRYYKRSGDSFYRMEHYDIADMFGRRKRPQLSLGARIAQAGSCTKGGIPYRVVHVFLLLENHGRGSAKSPYLATRIEPPHRFWEFGTDGNRSTGLPVIKWGGGRAHKIFGGSATDIIHPGEQRDIDGIEVEYPADATEAPDIRIQYTVGAEDVPLVDGEFEIPGRALL